MSNWDDEQIQKYIKTVNDGLYAFCPTCASARPVWVGETKGGDTLTCCCFCQQVLVRQKTTPRPASV